MNNWKRIVCFFRGHHWFDSSMFYGHLKRKGRKPLTFCSYCHKRS